MRSNFLVNRCRAGFSLTELAIVLGVASVILGGLWTLASSAQNKTREEETIHQVDLVVQGIRNYFTSVAPTNTDLINKLVDIGAVPSDMVVRPLTNPYTVRHALGGKIEVNYSGGTFSVKVEELKRKNCIALAPKLTGVRAAAGLTLSKIGTTSPAGTVVITPDFAAINCPADVAGAGVGTIELTYKIRSM